MITAHAAATYLAEHLATVDGRPVAVHNPHSVPLDALPVIYGYNHGGRVSLVAAAITADGVRLWQHGCTDEAYMPADLGIVEGCSPWAHEAYRAHYPDGYRMRFVRTGEDCPELDAARAAWAAATVPR